MTRKAITCIVINSTWNVINFRCNLLKHLQSLGSEVHIVAPRGSYVDDLVALGFIYHEWKVKPQSRKPFSEFTAILSLFWVLRNLRPQYCLTFTIKPNMYTALLSPFFKFKQIANVAGLGRVFDDNRLFARVLQSVYWYVLRNVFHIFFQNEDDKSKFVKSQNSRLMSVSVLPGSGVEIPLTPAPLRKRDVTVFLMFCRLLKSKGVHEYVLAADRVKAACVNVEFQLLGFHDVDDPDSVEKSDLDEWQSKSLINYMGATEDVSEYVINSDCVVLPSYYPEGTPRSLLEAGSFGRPIITTETPGCKDTVMHGVSGYLVQSKNVEKLTEALINFVELPFADRTALARNSFSHIQKNFDENIVLNEYEKQLVRATVLDGGGSCAR